MAAIDDPKTLGRARLSFATEGDVDEFIHTLDQFERGELGPDQWRTFRLLRGTYGQRQDGVQMIRIKIPQGLMDAHQARVFADVAERWSRGFGHITTRQNMQFHFVPLKDVPELLDHIAAAGLTTREACGNSVRNITTSPYAGVHADEVFDVTPYGEALTRYFLGHPLSSKLPRKFKIAFEGCAADHIYAAINDIGWFAQIKDGVRGFRVTVAGGTSTMARSGALLEPFVPASEMFNVAEAIVRVYHKHGDYQHKARNRMKWRSSRWVGALRRGIPARAGRVPRRGRRDAAARSAEPAGRGRARLAAGRAAERARHHHARSKPQDLRGPGIVPAVQPDPRPSAALKAQWRRTNVIRQKQPGYVMAVVTMILGDLTSHQLRVLADLAEAYSDGSIRVTAEQNLLFRWVKEADLDGLHTRLAAAGLGLAGANTVADVVSCPGAESCRIAVTQSRGLGALLGQHLARQPRGRGAGAGPPHQDQRLPQRLRPAPHRRPRLPGQHPQGRRQGGAAVLRDARRRRRRERRPVRPHQRQGAGAPHDAGRRSAARALSRREAGRREAGSVLPPRRCGQGEGAARRSRDDDRGRRGAAGLHRPRRGSRVRAGDHGRRVRIVVAAAAA